MEPIWKLLGVTRGLTAVIGSGGKTSLLYELAEELRPCGTVLLATTTHIMKPPQYPFAETAEQLAAALAAEGVACAGSFTPEGKLTAPDFDGWQQAADFVLVEADGSKRLPAKAHETWEPVLPPGGPPSSHFRAAGRSRLGLGHHAGNGCPRHRGGGAVRCDLRQPGGRAGNSSALGSQLCEGGGCTRCSRFVTDTALGKAVVKNAEHARYAMSIPRVLLCELIDWRSAARRTGGHTPQDPAVHPGPQAPDRRR